MLKRWLPWKFLVKRAARAYGVIDPLTLMAQLRHFSQPSEIQEPIELLRAGIVFHARGLVNTRAIQHNLDWVWPFWVEKQFNPADASFIPRAFSFSHVNLTHRNWTAVGQPDTPLYPIVDPRGLVTPNYDGWSVDFWLITEDGRRLLPSKLKDAEQSWQFSPELTVETSCSKDGLALTSRVWMECIEGRPRLCMEVSGSAPEKGHLVVSVRPYNPEGVQFVEQVVYRRKEQVLTVNDTEQLEFHEIPQQVLFSTYERGDVLHRIGDDDSDTAVTCEVGMATAAVLFPVEAGKESRIRMRMDLSEELEQRSPRGCVPSATWDKALSGIARLQVPDERICFLYDAAVRTLLLLSAEELVPGPYTYKRFWFRDACLMMHALLCLGFVERSARIIETFPKRQKRSGYFRSQEGEWDSNGQVLWIFERFLNLTGRSLPENWKSSIRKGADWITRKRVDQGADVPHAGLLPPGFSAEHFGPNDYYYWDDLWGVAGLRAAANMARRAGDERDAADYESKADDFAGAIWQSIDRIPLQRSQGAIPASPYRRLDAGAIGALVVDYPLQLLAPEDARIRKTAEFMMQNCLHTGAFFQDMIHSGLNPYLTLAIAQTLLRGGDMRFRELVLRVAEIASPTGQWPEAVHPFTGGGCMGDGQHGWAAAEWIMMLRNMFVREEQDALIVGSGIFPEWLKTSEDLSFGPTLTEWGPVTVKIFKQGENLLLEVQGKWRDQPPRLQARVPGFKPAEVDSSGDPLSLVPEPS